MKKIYFDYASTSPVDPLVIKAMEPYFSQAFGNPSSPHALGREANKALEESREKVARLIGAVPEEIIFNSGATEGNNHVLEEIIPSLKREANHVIVSSIEHHSVLEPIESLRAKGFNITFCPVDPEGLVNVDHLRKAMSEKTGFIAVMHASNEIGALQPIREIGQLARERKILFLADACQTIGHIPVNVKDFACDFLSFSAHKFYGPKGVGALYVRRGVNIAPYFRGGDQERGRRASTQNVAGAVGLAKALEIGHSQMGQEAAEQVKWRNRLLREVPKLIDGVKVNGHLTNRLPNNAHFSFDGLGSEALLMSLDMVGICASMGSACTSGAMEPSHVLRAIGLSDELAFGSLRISLGRWTTEEDIECLLKELPQIVRRIRI